MIGPSLQIWTGFVGDDVVLRGSRDRVEASINTIMGRSPFFAVGMCVLWAAWMVDTNSQRKVYSSKFWA